MSITIEVDTMLHVAYIQLSDEPVARTVAVGDVIQVDLDRFGVAVGIEVLDEQAPLPFQDLVDQFHVHSDVIELLRLIRPNVNSFLMMSHGHDGSSVARSAGTLAPA